jgi:hypothetical protein
MKKIFLLTTAIVLTALTACTKHAGDVTQNTTPEEAVITFASPTQGSVYDIGDSVSIQATCTSVSTLHGCDIIVRKAADGSVLYSTHMHDHATTLTINRKWKPELTEATNLEVLIKAAINHDGKTVTKKVGFRIQ